MTEHESYLKSKRPPGRGLPQTTINLSQPGHKEIWERARKYAREHGFTISSVAIEALAQFLDHEVKS